MNLYEVLAFWVIIIHWVFVAYWVGGFFVSSSRYPKFRVVHSAVGIVTFTLQSAFSFKCPLSLVSGYLRELAHPGAADSEYYTPFVVEQLKNIFGFQAPAILITIVTVIGTGLMIVVLLSIRRLRTRD